MGVSENELTAAQKCQRCHEGEYLALGTYQAVHTAKDLKDRGNNLKAELLLLLRPSARAGSSISSSHLLPNFPHELLHTLTANATTTLTALRATTNLNRAGRLRSADAEWPRREFGENLVATDERCLARVIRQALQRIFKDA